MMLNVFPYKPSPYIFPYISPETLSNEDSTLSLRIEGYPDGFGKAFHSLGLLASGCRMFLTSGFHVVRRFLHVKGEQ